MGTLALTKYTDRPAAVALGYHPEFGYLCPSPRTRRSIRLALISAGVGMLLGAVSTLSLLDRTLAQNSAAAQASAFGRTSRADVDLDKPSALANSTGRRDETRISITPQPTLAVTDGSSSQSSTDQADKRTAGSARASASVTKSAETKHARRHPRAPVDDGTKAFASASPYVEWFSHGDVTRQASHFGRDTWGWRQ